VRLKLVTTAQEQQSGMATLCAACTRIFQPGPGFDGWKDSCDADSDSDYWVPHGMDHKHHVCLDDLLQAVEKGCYICNRVLRGKEDSWDHFEPNGFDDSLLTFSRSESTDHSREFYIGRNLRAEDAGGAHALFLLRRLESLPSDSLCKTAPAPNTGSEISWACVEDWLKTCNEEHPNCFAGREPWHPTRLLEIVVPATPRGAQMLRLRRLPESSITSYVALSHCWGGIATVSLRHENKAELENGIPCDKLPKSFRDAVTVTLRLGLEYIWIDSLCIIQDSTEDWQQEASQMHKVYRNADVTIAATGAHNSTEGLFFDRHPDWIRPCLVSIARNDSTNEAFVVHDTAMWTDGIDKTPLNRRAWVLQERRLSRRIIHFSREQIFWECRTAVACETFPSGPFQPTSREHDAYKFPAKVMDQTQDSPAEVEVDVARLWNAVLEHYTQADLTRATDKLIAISGLAKTFARNYADRYLAGMWESSLVLQLPWTVRGTENQNKPIEQYVAPTWSWSSRNGPIRWSPFYRMRTSFPATELARVVDVQLEPSIDDPFGKLQGGYLRIEALALPVRISQAYDNDNARGFWVSIEGHEFRESRVYFDNEPPPLGKDIVLLVMYGGKNRLEPSKFIEIVGILLECNDDTPGRHRRVGALTVDPKDLSPEVQNRIQNRQMYTGEYVII
jgi:hypothetical protein